MKPIHQNVRCRECVEPDKVLAGWRHKCLNCANYDLCEVCFHYTEHDPTHVFATLKEPCHFTPLQLCTPLLAENLFTQRQVTSLFDNSVMHGFTFGKNTQPSSPPSRFNFGPLPMFSQASPYTGSFVTLPPPRAPQFEFGMDVQEEVLSLT